MSVFDMGATALQSIIGMYDPDYNEDSLGVYTMLLEVEWAIEQGYELYYIGILHLDFLLWLQVTTQTFQFFNPDSQQWFGIEQLNHDLLWSNHHFGDTKGWTVSYNHGMESDSIKAYDTIILHSLGDLSG